MIREPGELEALRAELRETLETLDRFEEEGALVEPTLEEADMIEAGLKEALEQVQERKGKS